MRVLNADTLNKLFRKVMEDASRPPSEADLVYLVGQTRSNESSVLDKAAELKGLIGLIGYNGTEEACGFPGFDHWKQELLSRNVAAGNIVGIEGSLVMADQKQIIHTLSELEAMVVYAKQQKLERVVLVAPYWHLLRSFMTAVLACRRQYPSLRVYPVLGVPLLWDEPALHSQGKVGGIRADFMFQETVRLFAYYEQGNLPSAEETLAYMQQRGS